jgi:NAD(P)-dependent dehydrogenase (short-subunit alcohol dehydrogenase family)
MHVIVTGGSSGIGLEVARLYAGRGAKVSLIARDADRLEQARRELLVATKTGDDRIRSVSADIAVEADIAAAIAACEAAFGPCDILVASAGMVEPGRFDEQAPEMFSAQLNTNLFGTVNTVRAVYRSMRSRQAGSIMIVSSGAALIGIHGYTAYCASKSALVGFAEALQAEARPEGICVSICFPPDTLTPQFEKELPQRSPEARRLMGAAPPWSAAAVARAIVRGLDRRRPKVYFGFSITALGLLGPLIKPLLFWFHRSKQSR